MESAPFPHSPGNEDGETLHRLLTRNPQAMDDWTRLTHLHSELASGVVLERSMEINTRGHTNLEIQMKRKVGPRR